MSHHRCQGIIKTPLKHHQTHCLSLGRWHVFGAPSPEAAVARPVGGQALSKHFVNRGIRRYKLYKLLSRSWFLICDNMKLYKYTVNLKFPISLWLTHSNGNYVRFHILKLFRKGTFISSEELEFLHFKIKCKQIVFISREWLLKDTYTFRCS